MELIASIARPPIQIAWVVEFTPDGDHVFFYPYSGDKTYIWSLRDSSIATVEIKTEGYQVAFQQASHNGEFVLVAPAIGYHPKALGCYSVHQERWIWWLTDLQSLRYVVAFSADDSEVVAFGEDDIYRIDSRTGKIRTRTKDILRPYRSEAYGLACSPDGMKFAFFRAPRGESLLLPLLTLLFVWNPHMEVWDLERNDVIASFGTPKWGFDNCEFTADGNYLVASQKGTLFRYCLADNSQESIDFPETPDALRDKNASTLSCATHDGATFVRLMQPVVSEGQITKHVQLYSFNGKRWNTVISDGGKGIGMSISPNEREMTVVCTDMVYTIDIETGHVVDRRRAQWCNQN